MNGAGRGRPDYRGLSALAAGQHGLFRADQAQVYGFSHSRLYELIKQGRLERRARGIYRFRDLPSSAHDDIAEAWLRVGPDAIASHETALSLHGLTDLMPTKFHFTVPRSSRGRRPIPGIMLHTYLPSIAVPNNAVQTVEGIPTMRPEVAVIQAAADGTDPSQIEAAVSQLHRRGTFRLDDFEKWLRAGFVSISKAQRSQLMHLVASGNDAAPNADLEKAPNVHDPLSSSGQSH